MRGSRGFVLMALGLATAAAWVAGCGQEFSAACVGDECDGIDDVDAGSDASADGASPEDSAVADDADAEPGCPAEASPADDACVIEEAYGVFVAPTGNDDSGDGSRSAPYATLGKGLAEAKLASKRLYVCDDGTGYAEQVAVDAALDGIAAYGGFACDSWAYGETKAKVKPAAPGIVWRFDDLAEGFLLADFDLEALDAEAKGESSVAVIVNASAGVVFRGLNIAAGKGVDGASPIGLGVIAESGKGGENGNPECSGNPNRGAAVVQMTCGAVETSGGKGGDGAIGSSSAGNGDPGLPETMNGGEAGIGQTGSACSEGRVGENGKTGDGGKGGAGIGRLDESGWFGAAGEQGKSGNPGQGGGGGGGGKRPTGCGLPVLSEAVGASGASGGGGGCGGIGGDGGSAGGASIALVSIDSELTLDACHLKSADAGDGGAGAHGQTGGSGGDGGRASGSACHGGKGGSGGSGGPGGGGAGGHSLGIAYKGDAPTRKGGSISVGAAGAGGQPGVPKQASGEGAKGRAAEQLEF